MNKSQDLIGFFNNQNRWIQGKASLVLKKMINLYLSHNPFQDNWFNNALLEFKDTLKWSTNFFIYIDQR